MEKARAARASLRQALLLCCDGEQMACSEFQDSRWVHKGLLMYYDRMQMPFVVGQGTLGVQKNSMQSESRAASCKADQKMKHVLLILRRH